MARVSIVRWNKVMNVLGQNIQKIDTLDYSYIHMDTIACNSEIEFTGSFRDIVTVICREGNELYLDEPEYGLSNIEISYEYNRHIRDEWNKNELE